MKKLIFLFLLVFISSCSKSENNNDYKKTVQRIKLLNEQSRLAQQDEIYSQNDGFSLYSQEISSGQNILDLTKGICRLISSGDFDNPFEFEKLFSSSVDFKLFSKYMDSFKQLSGKCISSEVIFDYYPISIIKFELGDENSLYGFFKVEQSGLVHTYYFLPNEGMSIEHNLVKTSDDESLSTIVFKSEKEKRKTIFIKTPYLQTDGFNYYIRNAYSFFNMGHNVVIQSNRGAHASTGDFKWLHERNILDSKETIDWMNEQKFSNGEVISYGVSYDGYNALAAAASNAEGLISAIACSAPANAATDSFTSGRTVEARLLSYIAERESPDKLSLFHEKFNYLQSINTPFSDFDNILYGRDIADWSDLMSARDSGSLDDYLKERSILEELKNSIIPIFHIAGSINDQDGRDTVLTYEYLKKESYHPERNFLYLHHKGHGCGPFWSIKASKDFLNANYEALSNEYRDHSKENYISEDIKRDFQNYEIALISKEDPSVLNNRNDLVKEKSLSFYNTFNDDFVVNGPIEVSFLAKSSLIKSSVLISIFKSEDDDWKPLHSMMNDTSRVSLYFEDSSEGEYSVTLPPMFFEIKKGDSLLIKVSASVDDFIDFFIDERLNYYEVNKDAGIFQVIDSNIKIKLPIERAEKMRD